MVYLMKKDKFNNLITKVRACKYEALGELYEYYGRNIKSMALCITLDYRAANEILDGVMLRICKSDFEQIDNPNLFIYILTKKISLGYKQSNTKSNSTSKQNTDAESADMPCVISEVEKTINKLSDRDIVLMHINFNIPINEIAKYLDISIDEAEQRYNAAIKTIANKLPHKEVV